MDNSFEKVNEKKRSFPAWRGERLEKGPKRGNRRGGYDSVQVLATHPRCFTLDLLSKCYSPSSTPNASETNIHPFNAPLTSCEQFAASLQPSLNANLKNNDPTIIYIFFPFPLCTCNTFTVLVSTVGSNCSGSQRTYCTHSLYFATCLSCTWREFFFFIVIWLCKRKKFFFFFQWCSEVVRVVFVSWMQFSKKVFYLIQILRRICGRKEKYSCDFIVPSSEPELPFKQTRLGFFF